MATYKGCWWTPAAAPEPLMGTLTHRRHNGLTLEVVGITRQGPADLLISRSALADPEHPKPLLVHGETPECDHFTLWDGFVKKMRTSSSGVVRTELVFNRGIRGACIDDPTTLRVDRAYGRFYGQEPWLAVNPFKVEYPQTTGRVTVTWERPAPISIKIDEHRTFVIRWDRFGPGEPIVQTASIIRSRAWLGVEYSSAVPVNDALEGISAIADLLTLLIGSPTSHREVEFRSPDITDDGGEESHRTPLHYMGASFSPKNRMKRWLPHDILLPFSAIADRFRDVVSKWFELRQRCWGAVVPYCLGQRAPGAFAEDRFFAHARSAESVHRNLRPDEKTFPDSERREIVDAMMASVPPARADLVRPPTESA